MEPLLNKIDKAGTIKNVEEHMISFSKIRHYYSVIDVDEADIFDNEKQSNSKSIPSKDKLLKQVNKTDSINSKTQEYLENLLKAINHLHPYYRKLILLKYFYEMDYEEISDYIGFSERKIKTDLRDAKIDLAFLLKCEMYVN